MQRNLQKSRQQLIEDQQDKKMDMLTKVSELTPLLLSAAAEATAAGACALATAFVMVPRQTNLAENFTYGRYRALRITESNERRRKGPLQSSEY